MKVLAFGDEALTLGGRRLRPGRFLSRSALPVAAARVVASGVRETLGSLLSAPVALRLFEPCLPSDEGWSAISRSAFVWRVRGNANDGAIVLRSKDARTLACAAFGETDRPEAPVEPAFSPLESEVLRRVVLAIAGNLQSVCGPWDRSSVTPEPCASVVGFATYFELQLERPAEVRIGIALAREPESPPAKKISPHAVLDVSLATSVIAESARIDARRLTRLRPGDLLTLDLVGDTFRGHLVAGSQRLASGEIGARDGRYALRVTGSRRFP